MTQNFICAHYFLIKCTLNFVDLKFRRHFNISWCTTLIRWNTNLNIYLNVIPHINLDITFSIIANIDTNIWQAFDYTTIKYFLLSQMYCLRSFIGKRRTPSTAYKQATRCCPFSDKNKSHIVYRSMYSSFTQTHIRTYIYSQSHINTKMSMCYVQSPAQQLLDICNNECIFPSALLQGHVNHTFSWTIKHSYIQVKKKISK